MPIISFSSKEEPVSGSVVIVEDDPLMHRLIVEIFTDHGADSIGFFSADEALMRLLQSKIPCALLITDFTLPGQLDGKELAMMVHKRWPSTAIIVTTGYGTEVSRDLPAGVAFLQKPWSLDQLVQTARHMLKTATNRS
ncbi:MULTISPECIES: response regulator [unclassified Pseudomonas]|jgi:DNA-binding NtrC family response regulator|uniref:response regulator n=1 Tax=unclassified Pseudomonas TaxID=196821 RepID=UPI001786112F|nr:MULTISPECIES: response regulator [unclassified Pseudomonas]MBD8710120.1 response regulator [Pseudomonas sp. CFBP 13711]MBD8715408.1 response regulator [Pseudomonas sp. CFBP 13715]